MCVFVCACVLSRALSLCLLLILTAACVDLVRIMHVCTLFTSDALVGMMAIVILLQVLIYCRVSTRGKTYKIPSPVITPSQSMTTQAMFAMPRAGASSTNADHDSEARKGGSEGEGVSIDLSKWDNSHGSATNRTKTLVARANAAWQAHSKTNSGESCASSSCPSLKQHVLPIYFPSILFLTRVHAKRFKATTCAHAPPPSRHPDHLHPHSHPCGPHCRDPHLWVRRQRAASQTSPASSCSGGA